MIEDQSTGEPGIGRLSAGVAVTVLVLSLPPEQLQRMIPTRAQVNMLLQGVRQLVTELAATADPHTHAAVMQTMRGGSAQDVAIAMAKVANQFMQTPQGRDVAQRFTAPLAILMHNAVRLERFAALDVSADAGMEDQHLLALLDEHVPGDFANAPLIDLSSASEEPTALALTFNDEKKPPPAAHVEAMPQPLPKPAANAGPSDTAAPRRGAKPLAKPTKAEKRLARDQTHRAQAAAAAKPATPAMPVEELACGPAATHPRSASHKQAGSKPTQPGEHHHPANKNMSREERDRRRDKVLAMEKGFGRFEKWTGDLRAVLRERMGERSSQGQQLVQPPPL
jgi:hypothetical protein